MSAPRSDPPPEPVVFPPPRKRLWHKGKVVSLVSTLVCYKNIIAVGGKPQAELAVFAKKNEVELKKAAKKMQKDIKKQRKNEQKDCGHMSIEDHLSLRMRVLAMWSESD